MKARILWLVVLTTAFIGLVWAQESGYPQEPEKEYKFSVAYAYRAEQLLLGDADYFSCFVLEKDPDTSLKVTDIKMFSDENDFSTPDLIRDGQSVFLNKGENAGMRKGQKYLVSGLSDQTHQGHALVIRKAIGEVLNVYSETAELRIVNLYNPVEIGDYLAEYKPQTPVSKLKIPYENTIVPDDADSVKVYLPSLLEFARTIVGPEQFVAIEMGKDKISVGELVVFFRKLKPHLPPLIMGTGVAVVVSDSLSTVKVIDAVSPIIEGSEAAILPEPKIIEGSGEEAIPVVRRISDEGEKSTEETMLTLEIPFAIDSAVVDESQSETLVKIKEFIESKTAYAVLLKGFCCSIGNEEMNLELSRKRVEAVKKVLMEQLEIPEGQIEAAYYGEKEAPYDNSSEEERRKNRLVMVVVTGK